MWIRRTFKSVSPDDTRGVFRKLKKTRGRTLNGGSPISGVSDRTMIWLGRVLVSFAGLFWSCFLFGVFLETFGFGFSAMVFFVVTHGLLIVGEMVTHRELPHRFLAMKIIWYPIIGLMIFLFLGSLVRS